MEPVYILGSFSNTSNNFFQCHYIGSIGIVTLVPGKFQVINNLLTQKIDH